MPETLLRTKLHVPALRPQLVHRPGLIDRLDDSLLPGRKLVLISAPAGFGKTTLVSEWISHLRQNPAQPSQTQNNIAWLSLDEADNDLTRFLSYLVSALDQVEGLDPALGKTALDMLQSSRPPPAPDILAPLINDITAFTGRVVFILDDYHLIDSPPVDKALIFFLDHLPPQMRLVIATRDDPPLPLPRLRARGQLTELRAADLRFTLSESAEFLNQVMDLDLSEETIAALESRTEGWIAGLQLAALALQGAISVSGRQDASGLVESFTGSHRFVLDYLIQEVLEQQSESVQTFLLQTAVLDRLSGPLCDALTGQTGGQVTLEMLERANLFVLPLDEERKWYRYHHLFADFLRLRLRQTWPEQLPVLHHRASQWYAGHGFADEAIDHALQGGDYEVAARLLQEGGDAFWGRGEHRKFRRWLDRLPEEIVAAWPYLAIFQARYQYNSGQMDDAERNLQAVEGLLGDGPGRAPGAELLMKSPFTEADRMKLQGRVAATRALMCSYRGDVPGIIHHANQALEYLSKEDLIWRSVTALTLGNAYGFQGDMTAAYRARFEASKDCQKAGDIYFILLANLEVAITLREQGRLRRTIGLCRKQLQFAGEHGLSQSRAVGWLLAVWGETLAELDDLDGAIDRAQKGFEITAGSDDLQMFGWSFMCLIRVLFSRGELDRAEKTIQEMERIARDSYLPPWITAQVAAWQARLWLVQNNPKAASRWAEDRGLDAGRDLQLPAEIGFFLLFDYLVLARILIAQERLDEATKLLKRLLEAAEAGGRTSKMIEITMLQALALQARGETGPALSRLEGALALAESQGFIRIFVDEGPPLAHLLQEALNRRIAPEYVRCLLDAFPSSEPGPLSPAHPPAPGPDQSGLIEPLSDRELEVLQGIAQGLTNREIADRLYLSLNTVKVHTRNIYGKLEVHSRTQAIARAQELGLLAP